MLVATPHGQVQRGLAGGITRVLDRIDHAYGESLRWVLRHRAIVIIGILGLFGGSLFLAKKIGTEFFPDTDEGQFQITYRTPIGTRVEKTEQVAMQLEQAVQKTLGPGFDPKDAQRALYTTI